MGLSGRKSDVRHLISGLEMYHKTALPECLQGSEARRRAGRVQTVGAAEALGVQTVAVGPRTFLNCFGLSETFCTLINIPAT